MASSSHPSILLFFFWILVIEHFLDINKNIYIEIINFNKMVHTNNIPP